MKMSCGEAMTVGLRVLPVSWRSSDDDAEEEEEVDETPDGDDEPDSE